MCTASRKQKSKKNSEWFTYVQAKGQTHFPHIEDPEFVYKETLGVIDRAIKRQATWKIQETASTT